MPASAARAARLPVAAACSSRCRFDGDQGELGGDEEPVERPAAPPRSSRRPGRAHRAPPLGGRTDRRRHVPAATGLDRQRGTAPAAPGRRRRRTGGGRSTITSSPTRGDPAEPAQHQPGQGVVVVAVAAASTPVAVGDLVEPPAARHHPRAVGPAGPAAGSGRSSSSRISPTSSSAMSSRVTMPAKPPYSSTTQASWRCSARSRSSTAGSGSVAGTSDGRRRRARPRRRGARSAGSQRRPRRRSRPPRRTSSTRVAEHREAGVAGVEQLDHPYRRVVARTVTTSTRGTIASPAVRSRKSSPRSSSRDVSASSSPSRVRARR